MVMLSLSACGSHRPADPAATSARSPPTPATAPAAGATRLVGGPVVLRVTDAPKPTATDLTAQLRYVVVFRLSRAPNLKLPSTDLRSDLNTQVGNYSIVDSAHGWSTENNIGAFGRLADHCFAAYLTTSTTFRALDAIRAGRRVWVSLQPATPSARGGEVAGRYYERRPRLLRADVGLRMRRARRALRGIGCSAASLR